MPVVMVHDSPGGTREQYEAVAERLTGGRGLESLQGLAGGGDPVAPRRPDRRGVGLLARLADPAKPRPR